MLLAYKTFGSAFRIKQSTVFHPRTFRTSTVSLAKLRVMAVVDKKAHPFTRENFEDLMRQRFFYTQSFEIYGGEGLCCAILFTFLAVPPELKQNLVFLPFLCK